MRIKQKNQIASQNPMQDSASSQAGWDKFFNVTSGSLPQIIRTLTIRSAKEAITTALMYASGDEGDDLVSAIIDTKRIFYAAGFDINVAPENKNYKNKLNIRIDEFCDEFCIVDISEELIRDLCTTDNCILTWKVGDKGIEYVMSVAPNRVNFDNTVGIEILEVDIDQKIADRIRNGLNGTKEQKKEITDNFPEKYLEAVRTGKNSVKLRNEDGEYWVVGTTARRFTGLAIPSMKNVFYDIMLRRLLVYGDWTVAYFVKRIIEHIKGGEAITNGPRAGSKDNYISKEAVDAIANVFKTSSSQALRLITDHTIDVKYYSPDVDLFKAEKFMKVEERIIRWGGVVDAIMAGKGDGFATNHIGVRRFVAQGVNTRRKIGSMFSKMMLHPSIRKPLGIPENTTVEVTWDEQNLKDPKQILDELNAMWDRGVLDVETYQERLGHKHDIIRSRKDKDVKEKDKWIPTFEPRQGLLSILLNKELGITDDNKDKKTNTDKKGGKPSSQEIPTEPDNSPRVTRTQGSGRKNDED